MSGTVERPLVSIEHVQNCLRAACILEASARKPGNVHPEASFVDLTFDDFMRAADRISVLAPTAARGAVGRAVFDAIESTRESVASNANLGIALLLAPLAAVRPDRTLSDGVSDVLERLNVDDAAWVYRAIRLAHPGGLGEVEDQDVSRDPTETLLHVMQLAADRDRIAFQYANRYSDVFEIGVPHLAQWRDFDLWEQAIIALQLKLLAQIPDSLIVRKCGLAVAHEASTRAQLVLDAGWPDASDSARELADFDTWLRADRNRRNPGTTADLIAACLFAALRDGLIRLPEIPGLQRNEKMSE